MKTSISIALGCLLAGLWAAAQVRADDFGQTVSRTVGAAGPGIKASLKKVGTRKPPPPSPVQLTFDANVAQKYRDQMGRDLAFVNTIQGQGASKLHQQVYTLVDGPTYIKWFADRVKSVGYDPKDKDIAYVDVDDDADHSKIWLARGYTKGRRPQIARVDDVFHEARHTEDAYKNWLHVDCPDPYQDAKGKDVVGLGGGKVAGMRGACDETAFGAYGTAALMLKNIQRFCGNCSEKVRLDAGLYGDDDVKRLIGPQAAQDIKADLAQ